MKQCCSTYDHVFASRSFEMVDSQKRRERQNGALQSWKWQRGRLAEGVGSGNEWKREKRMRWERTEQDIEFELSCRSNHGSWPRAKQSKRNVYSRRNAELQNELGRNREIQSNQTKPRTWRPFFFSLFNFLIQTFQPIRLYLERNHSEVAIAFPSNPYT